MQTFARTIMIMALTLVVLSTGPGAADTAPPAPVTATKTDKCPVCGMFVAKYPDFLAQIIYRDGSYALFDGAKDLFKYLFNIKKYHPDKERSEIAAIYVIDYYQMKSIDARTARYVVGSDVFGPMGRELIPFQQQAEAKEFIKDHAGKQLLGFEEITPELVQGLQ